MNEDEYLKKVRKFEASAAWHAEATKLIQRFESTETRRARVLDFGCGPGRFADMLTKRMFVVTGCDTSNAMLAAAKASYASVPFFKAGRVAIPAANESFDAVFCLHVLGHVPSLHGTMLEIERVLRPNGQLIVLNYNRRHSAIRIPSNWLKGYQSDPTIKTRFTLRQFTNHAINVGLEPSWSYYTGEALPMLPESFSRALFAAAYRKPHVPTG